MSQTVEQALHLPSFLCVGTQKGGTTWLYEMLSKHGDVWLPPIKELHYFNEVHILAHRAWTAHHRSEHVKAVRALGKTEAGESITPEIESVLSAICCHEVSDDWYRGIFSFARAGICGEFTPDYQLLSLDGIAHIRRLMPDAKIVFTVRDPIERAWSHIRMLISRGQCATTISDICSLARSEDILERSNYSKTLKTWRSIFPEDQMLILDCEMQMESPKVFLNIIFKALGLNPDKFPNSNLFAKIHVGKEFDMPDEAYKILKHNLEVAYDSSDPEIGSTLKLWKARHFSRSF